MKIKLFLFLFIINLDNTLAESMLFDDFKKSSIKSWTFITDQVMGGVSDGNIKYIVEGNNHFIRMNGVVSTKNNGGFIQFRKLVGNMNLDINSGFEVEARGNEEEYFMHLRTKGTILPWQYYQASFKVSKDWKAIKIKLEDFSRSGIFLAKKIKKKDITSIAFVAFGKDYKVNLEIKNIIFF